MGEARQLPDVATAAHITDHVTRMAHVQGLKVIVDGVAHNHLALQHAENLERRGQHKVYTSVNSFQVTLEEVVEGKITKKNITILCFIIVY